MRRSILLGCALCFLTTVCVPQSVFPPTLPFQGRLVKQIGGNVNGATPLTLRLYTVPAGGTALWTEVQPAVAVTGGLFKTELGKIAALPATLFDGRTFYLGIQVGNDKEMVPRLVLTSQAYAQLAKNAHDVKAQIVVEAANSPTGEGADEVFADRGITVIPDILANAGGVTGSYFEWTQNIQQFTWPRDRFEKELEVRLSAAYEATRALSLKKAIDLRLAAYCIGIGRVAEAITLRGHG